MNRKRVAEFKPHGSRTQGKSVRRFHTDERFHGARPQPCTEYKQKALGVRLQAPFFNIAQIDTPYLTEGSSGLTYVVERFQGWEHAATITLTRGERSRLAEFAAEAL